jgi:hypothetical protein
MRCIGPRIEAGYYLAADNVQRDCIRAEAINFNLTKHMAFRILINASFVADSGNLFRIPDTNIFPSQIPNPDPNSFHPGSYIKKEG